MVGWWWIICGLYSLVSFFGEQSQCIFSGDPYQLRCQGFEVFSPGWLIVCLSSVKDFFVVIFSGSAQLSQTSTAFIPRPTSALLWVTLGQRLMIRTPADLYGICMVQLFFHGDPSIQFSPFSFQAILIYDWPWFGFLYSFCSKPHAFLEMFNFSSEI